MISEAGFGIYSKRVTAKDFGAVGDGVTDDTKAIQMWAIQTDMRDLGYGDYLISEPIVFAVGGSVCGLYGKLKLSDNFVGDSVLKCKATRKHYQEICRLSVDMNNQDIWVISERDSAFVRLTQIHINNAKKFIDCKMALDLEITI